MKLSVIFPLLIVAGFLSPKQDDFWERWYFNWLNSGGYEKLAEQEAKEAQVREAQRKYDELENLKKMYQLTIEIDQIDRELNATIDQKGQLFNNNLVSVEIEVKIKKLAKQLKEKVDALQKLSR